MTGRLLRRTIAGGVSGFAARPAEIYLPPDAVTDPARRLPVLELLHGGSGDPTSWLTEGHLLSTAETFARTHQGRAPIIVMPDINGALHDDTECIRTPSGADVETYLAEVVPAWTQANLPASPDHRQWAVAGLSEGGTCAAMLALRHPSVFEAFGDLSGLAHLTLGATDHRARTVAGLFGGSSQAYDQHDPPWLLAHHTYRGLAAWFECGADDTTVLRDQTALVHAASAAGVLTHDSVLPGTHAWSVWTRALAQMLPWLWAWWTQ